MFGATLDVVEQPTALGPLAWLLCLQYFVAEQVARAGYALEYRARFNFISDLGAVRCMTAGPEPVCSPLHAVMNGSFVLQGALIVTGSVLCRAWLPPGRSVPIARALLLLSGVALALVGAFPEDVNPVIHYRVAAVHFVCADLGMLVLGAALVACGSNLRGARLGGVLTSLCALVAIVGLVLLGARAASSLGVGAVERIAAYPFPLWLGVTGAVLGRSRRALSPH